METTDNGHVGLIPIFIPSYHRPNNIKTLKLTTAKYEYPANLVYVFIDDEGGDEEQYRSVCEQCGCGLVVFSQKKAREKYDYIHRPSPSRRSAGQARNMMHEWATRNGIGQYIVIDDDLENLRWRPFGQSLAEKGRVNGPQLHRSVMGLADLLRRWRIGLFGYSQGGEMLVSVQNPLTRLIRKKVMNFSFYITELVHGGERGVQDDDTSQYVTMMNNGLFCASFASGIILIQAASAMQPGGLTDLYYECKLLNKALVTVIQYPSAIHAEYQKKNGGRLHHRINYKYLMPMLLKVKRGNNIAWDTYGEDVPFTCVPKRTWKYED